MHSAIDLFMCLGDFNGHVGRHIDGFEGVHGVGQKNFTQDLYGEINMCLRERKICTGRK